VKTKTSVRTVELPDVVAAALTRHIERGIDPMTLDDDTDPRGPTRRRALLLFRGLSGEPVNAATFSRQWSRVRAVAGLQPRWGIHNPTVTLNTCVHEWPDAVDRTRSLIDTALGQTKTAATSAEGRA
jgi:hypothetical protein